ncbi:RsmD family RNA methyltransferase, partial [Parasphingorhabdus sp.]
IVALEKNITTLTADADVRIGSVLGLGPARRTYDLILMDPPYETGAGSVALSKLGRLGWFAPSSWIAIETSRRENIDVKGFDIDCVRDSGKARITLLRPHQDS